MDSFQHNNEILSAYELSDSKSDQATKRSTTQDLSGQPARPESASDAKFDAETPASINTSQQGSGSCKSTTCQSCQGTSNCAKCGGTGFQRITVGAEIENEACHHCSGSGWCRHCRERVDGVPVKKPTETWSDTYRDRSDTSLKSKPMQSSNEGGCLLAIAGVACIAISPLFGCFMPIPFSIGVGLCAKANKKIWKD